MPKSINNKKRKLIISKKKYINKNNKKSKKLSKKSVVKRNKGGGSKRKDIKGKRKSKKMKGGVKMNLRKRILRGGAAVEQMKEIVFHNVKDQEILAYGTYSDGTKTYGAFKIQDKNFFYTMEEPYFQFQNGEMFPNYSGFKVYQGEQVLLFLPDILTDQLHSSEKYSKIDEYTELAISICEIMHDYKSKLGKKTKATNIKAYILQRLVTELQHFCKVWNSPIEGSFYNLLLDNILASGKVLEWEDPKYKYTMDKPMSCLQNENSLLAATTHVLTLLSHQMSNRVKLDNAFLVEEYQTIINITPFLQNTPIVYHINDAVPVGNTIEQGIGSIPGSSPFDYMDTGSPLKESRIRKNPSGDIKKAANHIAQMGLQSLKSWYIYYWFYDKHFKPARYIIWFKVVLDGGEPHIDLYTLQDLSIYENLKGGLNSYYIVIDYERIKLDSSIMTDIDNYHINARKIIKGKMKSTDEAFKCILVDPEKKIYKRCPVCDMLVNDTIQPQVFLCEKTRICMIHKAIGDYLHAIELGRRTKDVEKLFTKNDLSYINSPMVMISEDRNCVTRSMIYLYYMVNFPQNSHCFSNGFPSLVYCVKPGIYTHPESNTICNGEGGTVTDYSASTWGEYPNYQQDFGHVYCFDSVFMRRIAIEMEQMRIQLQQQQMWDIQYYTVIYQYLNDLLERFGDLMVIYDTHSRINNGIQITIDKSIDRYSIQKILNHQTTDGIGYIILNTIGYDGVEYKLSIRIDDIYGFYSPNMGFNLENPDLIKTLEQYNYHYTFDISADITEPKLFQINDYFNQNFPGKHHKKFLKLNPKIPELPHIYDGGGPPESTNIKTEIKQKARKIQIMLICKNNLNLKKYFEEDFSLTPKYNSIYEELKSRILGLGFNKKSGVFELYKKFYSAYGIKIHSFLIKNGINFIKYLKEVVSLTSFELRGLESLITNKTANNKIKTEDFLNILCAIFFIIDIFFFRDKSERAKFESLAKILDFLQENYKISDEYISSKSTGSKGGNPNQLERNGLELNLLNYLKDVNENEELHFVVKEKLESQAEATASLTPLEKLKLQKTEDSVTTVKEKPVLGEFGSDKTSSSVKTINAKKFYKFLYFFIQEDDKLLIGDKSKLSHSINLYLAVYLSAITQDESKRFYVPDLNSIIAPVMEFSHSYLLVKKEQIKSGDKDKLANELDVEDLKTLLGKEDIKLETQLEEGDVEKIKKYFGIGIMDDSLTVPKGTKPTYSELIGMFVTDEVFRYIIYEVPKDQNIDELKIEDLILMFSKNKFGDITSKTQNINSKIEIMKKLLTIKSSTPTLPSKNNKLPPTLDGFSIKEGSAESEISKIINKIVEAYSEELYSKLLKKYSDLKLKFSNSR